MVDTVVHKLPEWNVMLERFKDYEHDKIISYAQLDKCLFNGSIRENKRYVFDRFKKEMLKQECKALENVPNRGYRITKSNEHVRLTNREVKRAERRARVACEIILHTDMERLTTKEKMIATTAAQRVQPILAMLIAEQKSLKETQKFSLPEMPHK